AVMPASSAMAAISAKLGCPASSWSGRAQTMPRKPASASSFTSAVRIWPPMAKRSSILRRSTWGHSWTCNASELVERHLEIGLAVVVLGRQLAATHVDLQRGDDQLGHGQRLVALLAHPHELVLAGAVANMDIVLALLGHRGFPLDVAAVRAVVVAHEQAHLARQGEHPLDRAVKGARIAAGEVGAGGA